MFYTLFAQINICALDLCVTILNPGISVLDLGINIVRINIIYLQFNIAMFPVINIVLVFPIVREHYAKITLHTHYYLKSRY